MSSDAFVGLRDMARELSRELESAKLSRLPETGVSRTIISGIGNDVVLY